MSETMDSIDLMELMQNEIDNTVINGIKVLIKKRKAGEKTMQMFDRFIGQECIIYILGGTTIEATVDEVGDGWIRITDQTKSDNIINVDFITRIREYPRNKNGKKRSVFV